MKMPFGYDRIGSMSTPAKLSIALTAIVITLTGGQVRSSEATRVLWREEPMQRLKVNEDFIARSPEHVRAILAFLSTRAGTACQQTEPNVVTVDLNDPDLLEMELADLFTPAKLTCELSSEIGFDDQCSDEHIAFVKKWFRRDSAVFQELNKCARVPATAGRQRVFSAIEIEEKGNVVDVRYTITHMDNRNGSQISHQFFDRYELDFDMLHRTVHEQR